ncbi:MAG: hypothetical protein A2580_17900 [Hydrogenophilales bacterium RIFOXYD1_FULL_62_11]|nr:MAG: hypothetical protein A2580_17900 [Hydrogenophilales bacterium RIFOXYD1_FULL_62_11]
MSAVLAERVCSAGSAALPAAPTGRREDIDACASEVLAMLQNHSYEDTAAHFRTSRGKVYSLAVRAGARKNEAAILERKADRRRRQLEFMESVVNSVQKADVLDFLAGLPDDSVPLHLCSPPYNLGLSYGQGASADAFSYSYYLGWSIQVLSEMARTLAPGGTLFYQVGSTRGPDGGLVPIDTVLFQHLITMGLTFKTRIAWVVPHGLTPKRRLAERYETALVFTKGPEHRVFNPDPVRTPQRQPGKRAFRGPNKGQLSGNPFGAHPSNVWTIPNARHNAPGRVEGHPAQMPVELARRAILLWTLPGDLVVDCFSGSGTTAEAAIRTGRAFSGCDLFYEDLRAQRLAAVSPDLSTPLPGITDESLAVWQAEARPVHVPARDPDLFDAPVPG